MYIQITSKCNMKCLHCCYSCNSKGKHMDFEDVMKALYIAKDYSDSVSIGGGEPTLHPRFFDILRHSLRMFDYVWMATNGSKTKIMFRLYDILTGNDYNEDIENEYDCIYQENKLAVALSQDYFHAPINQRVVDLWTRRAKSSGYNSNGFEIRDVTTSNAGVIGQGRAKRTGNYQTTKDCVCPDLFIGADGNIKLCGCTKSPIIGHIYTGILPEHEDKLQDEGYLYTNCYKTLGRKESEL